MARFAVITVTYRDTSPFCMQKPVLESLNKWESGTWGYSVNSLFGDYLGARGHVEIFTREDAARRSFEIQRETEREVWMRLDSIYLIFTKAWVDRFAVQQVLGKLFGLPLGGGEVLDSAHLSERGRANLLVP